MPKEDKPELVSLINEIKDFNRKSLSYKFDSADQFTKSVDSILGLIKELQTTGGEFAKSTQSLEKLFTEIKSLPAQVSAATKQTDRTDEVVSAIKGIELKPEVKVGSPIVRVPEFSTVQLERTLNASLKEISTALDRDQSVEVDLKPLIKELKDIKTILNRPQAVGLGGGGGAGSGSADSTAAKQDEQTALLTTISSQQLPDSHNVTVDNASLAVTHAALTELGAAINSNLVDVNIVSGAGSGGTAIVDDAAFTAATTSLTPVGGIVTSDAVDAGDAGAFAMLANRQQKVTLYDSGGVELAVGGGTQYTEDAAAAANPVGNALNLVRADALAGVTTTDGDNVAARGTDKGELYVKHVDAIPVTDNGGALTVDGTVAVTNAGLTALNGAITGTEVQVDVLTMPTVAVTQSGTWDEVGINDSGNSITVDNGGTFVTQVDGSALTALQLIDDSIFADDAAFTLASSKTTVGGAVRDDSLSTLTAVEGDVVPLRVNSTGALHVTGAGGGTQYQEDAIHATGDTGTLALSVRKDTAAQVAGTDGDYSVLITDASGRLHVQPPSITSGAGAVGATTPRMTLASDDPAVASLAILDNVVSGTEAQVDVVAALPAGTNNIGDVDVASSALPTGASTLAEQQTQTTALQLVDDVIYVDDADWTDSTSKHALVGGLYQSTPQTITDGDVGPLALDSAGNLRVNIMAGSSAGVQYTEGDTDASITGTAILIETGTDVLASVKDDAGFGENLAAGIMSTHARLWDGAAYDRQPGNSTDGALVNLGANNDVTVTGSLTSAGAVTNAGTFAVQVDGSALTALQLIDDTVFAEDVAAQAADKGLAILAVRRDADTSLVGTDNDYANLQVNANGALKVEAFSGEALPVTLTSTTVTGTVAVTQSGTWDEVGINDSGNSITVDNGGTFAVQVDGSALTALQLIDDPVFADDAAFTLASSKVSMAGAIRDDSLATLTAIEGDAVPLRVSSTGALHVTGGGGGTEYTEDAAAPADPTGATFLMTRDDQLATVTEIEGDWSRPRGTSKGALWVALADSAGDPITSFGGGTEYTVNAAAPADPVGATFTMERDDALSALTEIEGDWTNPRSSANGALWVAVDGTVAVTQSGTWDEVGINDSGNSITVDNAQLSVVGTGTEAAAMRVTIATDSTGVLSVDDNGGNISIDDGGNTITVDGTVAVTGVSTLAEQQTQTTALQLIDDIVYVDDTATHSTGSSKGALFMAAAVPTDTSVSANDIGAVAMTTDRKLHVAVMDALPAGTAAIGKLAANSGVDIGDVDITSIAAGDNNIGNVDIVTLPALAAGTNNIGDVDVLSLPATPAGTNAIGKLLPPDIDVTTHTNYAKKYYTNAGAVTDGIVWSPAAGKRWHVVSMYVQTSAAATVTFEDDLAAGDSAVLKSEFAANSGTVINFSEKYPLASGEDAADLIVTTSAGNIYITITGYEV